MIKYKNLFIDLDDTLWDTYHNNQECLEEMYNTHHWDQHYASFEAFFSVYWPYNNLLWSKYRNREINRQTLIFERFHHVLSPMGIEDPQVILAIFGLDEKRGEEKRLAFIKWFSGSSIKKTHEFRTCPLFL